MVGPSCVHKRPGRLDSLRCEWDYGFCMFATLLGTQKNVVALCCP